MIRINKKELSIKKINIEKALKIFLFLLVTVIFYFVPYTHDDWAWGTQIGIDRLTSLFHNYNGRWAGNLLVILLTRSRLLRAVFISCTMFIMIKLINKIINKNNKQIIYIASILIMLMPYSIIAQTLAWTSGFTNYVISFLLVLIFIYLNRNIFSNEASQLSKWMIIPMMLLGFIVSLFMENLTIYNIILSIFILLYEYCRIKKVNLANIFYFIGSVVGSILMFSNGAYHNIMNSADGYRTIEQGNIIVRCIRAYFDTIYNYLAQNNIVLNILIGILVLVLIYRFLKKENKISKIKKTVLSFSAFAILAYLSYIIFIYVCDNANIFIIDKYKKYLEGIGILIYWGVLIASSIIVIKDKPKRFRILFETMSIVILTGPLFIVTPIGPRNFFITYILFVMLAVEIFDYINSEIKLNINKGLIIVTIILILFYCIIFGYVYKIESIRNKYIEENKMNTEELYLPNLPFVKYMQGPNPVNNIFMDRFKLFYQIENEVKVIFVDYANWK